MMANVSIASVTLPLTFSISQAVPWAAPVTRWLKNCSFEAVVTSAFTRFDMLCHANAKFPRPSGEPTLLQLKNVSRIYKLDSGIEGCSNNTIMSLPTTTAAVTNSSRSMNL